MTSKTALRQVVNMTPAELDRWRDDPRSRLASTDVGHAAIGRVEALLRTPERAWTDADREFSRKAIAFYRRHRAQAHLFGPEVGQSGYSRRHIALRNWGHDPTKRGSDLYERDRRWVAQNDGALARRRSPNGLYPPPPARSAELVTAARDLLGASFDDVAWNVETEPFPHVVGRTRDGSLAIVRPARVDGEIVWPASVHRADGTLASFSVADCPKRAIAQAAAPTRAANPPFVVPIAQAIAAGAGFVAAIDQLT